MKVLIVDDDALLLKALGHHLEAEKHKVISARDGTIAEKLLVAKKPDLVICDLLMPNQTGVGFIKRLREHYKLQIPVIVISTLDNGDLITLYTSSVNIEFIAKPIDFRGLSERVAHYNNILQLNCKRKR